MATSTAVQAQYQFADVVRAMAGDPPEPYSELPGGRLYSLAALFAYTLTHPAQFLKWAQQSLNATGSASPDNKNDWVELKGNVRHFVALWWLALRGDAALLKGPIDLSQAAFLDYNGTRPRRFGQGPLWPRPATGWVRVRWYPDVEATRKWPDDLGVIWVDVKLGARGDLDLTPAMRYLGMENCYVIDANRGKPQLSRRPVEKLSALAVQVLLGEEENGEKTHNVIGVVEQPSELLQEARQLRARLDEWRYCIEDCWKLPIPSILAQVYAYSARYFYDVADEVSSTVLLCFFAVFAVLLYTLVDSIALVHGKVIWPLLATIVLPVLLVLFQTTVRCVRAALPWIWATMEAALLSGEEIEELQRLHRGGSPSSTDGRSDSESLH